MLLGKKGGQYQTDISAARREVKKQLQKEWNTGKPADIDIDELASEIYHRQILTRAQALAAEPPELPVPKPRATRAQRAAAGVRAVEAAPKLPDKQKRYRDKYARALEWFDAFRVSNGFIMETYGGYANIEGRARLSAALRRRKSPAIVGPGATGTARTAPTP